MRLMQRILSDANHFHGISLYRGGEKHNLHQESGVIQHHDRWICLHVPNLWVHKRLAKQNKLCIQAQLQ